MTETQKLARAARHVLTAYAAFYAAVIALAVIAALGGR